MNGESPSIIQDVTWSLEGELTEDDSTNISQDGRLYIGGNEPEGGSITVQVETKGLNGDPLSETVTFTVRDWELTDLKTVPTGTITTAEIDGRDFYLLARNGNRALIWAKESVKTTHFGNSNQYEGSTAQNSLNRWLKNKSTLNSKAYATTIYTRQQVNSDDFVTSANQKVFLLSEADLFGTFSGGDAKPNDYTWGGKQLVSNESAVRSQLLSSSATTWLRSPRSATTGVATLTAAGSLGPHHGVYYGLRPALWITLD